MSALVVIPARYGSTRFPGKPLAMLQGKPVIQHVYERAARARRAGEVVVATDDERIMEAVRAFKGRAVMTSPDAASGTERVAYVARGRRSRVVINVQGDEPLVHPDMIDQLAECLAADARIQMASLMTPMGAEQGDNPNAVKVVVDREGFALYFSRAPIPHVRDPERRPMPRFYKHLGIYGYQREFLLAFPSLESTTLEQLESLEQLRAIEHGYQIKLLETLHDTIGVDTPEDLERVERLLTRVP
jgi:3-deoxy-manno-octulosonate cytidylyltransferase (CMP-KDO synthetase)